MTIKYLKTFVFHGTKRRLGVGHISLADHENYYSFSSSPITAQKIVPPDPFISQSNSLKTLLSIDVALFGDFHSVILPANAQLNTNLKRCQQELSSLVPRDYNLFNQNCAHAIQSYFATAGYLKKIIDYIFPLTPGELGNKLAEIGQSMVDNILLQLENENKKINLDYEAMVTFISNLINNRDCPKDIKDIPLTGENILDHYSSFLKILAKRHYERTEPVDFYANQYAKALEICPIQPEYSFKEHRILKSIPRTFGSALLVTVLIPAGIAALTLSIAGSIAAGTLALSIGILLLPLLAYHLVKSKAAEQNNVGNENSSTTFYGPQKPPRIDTIQDSPSPTK